MKFITTISALALLLTKGLEALTISSPSENSVYGTGQSIAVLVVNDSEESFVSASVTFASACGNIVMVVPVGTTQTLYLPCQIVGQTVVAARVGDTQAVSVNILVSPAYNTNIPYAAGAGCGYPYAGEVGCGIPYGAGAGCGSPCGPIACPPRRSSHRGRRGCGYYGTEEAVDVAEFVAEHFEQEEQQQQKE